MMSQADPQYIIQNETDVALLNCTEAFNGLTPQERFYAHHLAQASFKGGLIDLFQTSPESPGIFVLLQKLFRTQSPDELSQIAKSVGFTDADVKAFLIYAASFYCNMGNYKSFGDTKFVPAVEMAKVESLIMASQAYEERDDRIDALWDDVKDRMYSLYGKQKELGLGDQGTTTYYSANCHTQDAKIAQAFMDSKDISPYNTRLFKTKRANGQTVYEIRMASTDKNDGDVPGYSASILGDYDFQPEGSETAVKFKVTRGDYSHLMAMLCAELTAAQYYVSNDGERNMVAEYIKSFSKGSIPSHKEGTRHWIKNKGPIVEAYIGFIESYRDPYGVRGEFEGFVAVVNKAMSAKFTKLVENAEFLLAHLPWPAEYEKNDFLLPDFTSLDVLAFGGSGIPAGINIPNYDDIRQTEGFKNVSLGNVLTSGYSDTKITFIREEDKAVYAKYKIPSFEVQVGLHELLGHGSGKLFREDVPGEYNFDIKTITHAVTKGPITKWYKAGETWDSIFSSLSSTYEECRAECVAIYICLLSDALKIFGHTGDAADDIIFVNWLNMVRQGLLALEFYSPETGKWKQAHMNARFVILRVLLEAGDGLVKVDKFTGDDGDLDLSVVLDRAKINTVGKTAIGIFLKKLQVYKSTADFDAASKMYSAYSDVNDHEAPHFLSLRKIVLARKQQRKLFVQQHTYIEDGEVKLKSYEATPSGLIQSNVDRFSSESIDQHILDLWKLEQPHY